MGFPLDTLDLGADTAHELNSLAGNAFHVKSVAMAMLIALTLVDKDQFRSVCKDLDKAANTLRQDPRGETLFKSAPLSLVVGVSALLCVFIYPIHSGCSLCFFKGEAGSQ